MDDADLDCVETYEKAVAALEAVEATLAMQLNLEGDVHEQILDLVERDLLPEDKLVRQWHKCFCTVLNWRKYLSDEKSARLIEETARIRSEIARIQKNNVKFLAETQAEIEATEKYINDKRAETAALQAETAKIQEDIRRIEADTALKKVEIAKLQRGNKQFEIALYVFCLVCIATTAYLLATKL